MALFKCVVEAAWTGIELVREGEVRDLDPAIVYDENGVSEAWEPVDPHFARPAPKLSAKAPRKSAGKRAGEGAEDGRGESEPALFNLGAPDAEVDPESVPY